MSGWTGWLRNAVQCLEEVMGNSESLGSGGIRDISQLPSEEELADAFGAFEGSEGRGELMSSSQGNSPCGPVRRLLRASIHRNVAPLFAHRRPF